MVAQSQNFKSMKGGLQKQEGSKMKGKLVFMLIFVAFAGIVFTGCPRAAREMIEEAESAMSDARKAGAPDYAPEEYKSAEESLIVAHKQFDNRKYSAARSFAITARDQAVLARDRARERKLATDAGGRAVAAEGEDLAYNVPSLYGEEELGAGEDVTFPDEATREQVKIAVLKDIHFDFDQYYITEDARAVMVDNARWMNEHPSAKIRIEGHCDDRGAEEYNLALGEKRAEAAMNYLIRLGISPSRLSTISYGESLPIDSGHNEAAWTMNRRAHFAIIE